MEIGSTAVRTRSRRLNSVVVQDNGPLLNDDVAVPTEELPPITNNKLYYKIRNKDLRPLAYLYDIQSKRTPDRKGFKLEFFFDGDENPYFSNKSLTKTYELLEDSNSFVSLKATGRIIDWKASKNVTKMRGGSFFNFFKSLIIAPIDDPLWFDMEADELKGDLPGDFVIGHHR